MPIFYIENMKKSIQILLGYLTCTIPVIVEKWQNILASFVHKDEIVPEFIITRGKTFTEFNYVRPDGEPRTGRAYHLDIKLKGDIDFDGLKPKLMIYRYKPKRIKTSGVVKSAGWYHEKEIDANLNGRFSEFFLTASENSINLKPENYFAYNSNGLYYPTGYKIGSGKWTKKGRKKYIYLQLRILLNVAGKEILSKPKTVRLLHEWHNSYTFELINI